MKYVDRYTLAQILTLIVGLSLIWFIPMSVGYDTHIDNDYKGKINKTVNTTMISQSNMISVHSSKVYNIYGMEMNRLDVATKFIYVPNTLPANWVTIDKDHLNVTVNLYA